MAPFLALNAILLSFIGGMFVLCEYCTTSRITCCNRDFLDLIQAPQQVNKNI
jgi:hypothetical protein